MLAGVMSRCITPRRCIPATARASSHGQPDQLIDGQWRGQPGQAGAAGVRQHDRPRVPRRLHQLRDARDTAQPLQHRHLVPQPPRRVRPQRLLADDRAPRQGTAESPACARSRAALRPERADLAPAFRPHPACPHPTPPHITGPTSYGAYTYADGKATALRRPGLPRSLAWWSAARPRHWAPRRCAIGVAGRH